MTPLLRSTSRRSADVRPHDRAVRQRAAERRIRTDGARRRHERARRPLPSVQPCCGARGYADRRSAHPAVQENHDRQTTGELPSHVLIPVRLSFGAVPRWTAGYPSDSAAATFSRFAPSTAGRRESPQRRAIPHIHPQRQMRGAGRAWQREIQSSNGAFRLPDNTAPLEHESDHPAHFKTFHNGRHTSAAMLGRHTLYRNPMIVATIRSPASPPAACSSSAHGSSVPPLATYAPNCQGRTRQSCASRPAFPVVFCARSS